MMPAEFPANLPSEALQLGKGALLLQRLQISPWVDFVESGRVAIGLVEGDTLVHQLGETRGPAWLEASDTLLGLAPVMDAQAETDLRVRRVAAGDFCEWLAAQPRSLRSLMIDLATAHRQQSERAVSHLVKDAEARCAEWLLRHAQTSPQGAVAVMLQQRKRLIAAQLGIAPETLSRVLRHLRERSLISGSGRVVNLVDPGALRSLAGV
jgi:CRP-like cAMP-binding protein